MTYRLYCKVVLGILIFVLLATTGSHVAWAADYYPQWKNTRTYVSGDRVYWQAHDWQAKYWTRGDEPGADPWGPWTDLGPGTPPPPPGPIQAFPERVFAPYIDILLYPTPDLGQIAAETQILHYTLAFITSKDGEPAWGGVIPLDDNFYMDEIEAVRRKGGDVVVSFGGANGMELAMVITDVAQLKGKYQSVIDRYRLSWVDFDIEGRAVADKPSIDRRNKAIRGLQADNPGLFVAFCLPVLPSGLTADGLYVLQNARQNDVRIDLVNIMAMNYGSAVVADPADLGPEAIRAAESVFRQLADLYPHKSQGELWNMLGITPMIGRNDTVPLVFYAQAAQEVSAFGMEKNLKMLSMWSIARDKACPHGGTQVSATCSGVSQENWAFADIFKTFTSGSSDNLKPVADFSHSISERQVTFNSLSSDADGTIVKNNWDFGDGETSIQQHPSHTYAAAGTYTVKLTVEDDKGAVDSKSISIRVGGGSDNIPPTAAFSHVSQGLTVTFNDQSSDPDGRIVDRKWDFGDSSPQPGPDGRCDNVKAWDEGQNWTAYQVGDLRTNAGHLWACINVGFAYHEPSGSYGHFGWRDQGACGSSGGSNGDPDGRVAKHTYPRAGTYTVALTVTDDKGAVDTARIILTVGGGSEPNQAPAAAFKYSRDNLTVSFVNNSRDPDGTIEDHHWDFGDGHTSPQQHAVHTYVADGTYMVTLTVTDDRGARDQIQRTVVLADPPVPDVPQSGQLKFSYQTTSQAGDSVTGQLNIQNPNVTYAWNGTYFAVWDVAFQTTATIQQITSTNGTVHWRQDGDRVTVDLGWQSLFDLGQSVSLVIEGTGKVLEPTDFRARYVRGENIDYPAYQELPASWQKADPDLAAEDLIVDEQRYYDQNPGPVTDGMFLYQPPSPTQVLIGQVQKIDSIVNSQDDVRIWVPTKYLAMGLGFVQEVFKINPNYMCALGTKENFATGVIPSGGTNPVVIDGQTWNWPMVSHPDGPFQQETGNFNDASTIFPDFFPPNPVHDTYTAITLAPNDLNWISATISSAISLTVTRETLHAVPNAAFHAFVTEARDPSAETTLLTFGYNRGIYNLFSKQLFTTNRQQALAADNLREAFNLNGHADHVGTILAIMDQMNQDAGDLYDAEIQWPEMDDFLSKLRMFYANDVPGDDQWIAMVADVRRAFDVLADHWGGTHISLRYDFVTLMRVVKQYLPEPHVPRPTSEQWYYMVKNLIP